LDFAITIEDQTGPGAMTFDKATTIMNNIYLSLKVKRGSFFANTIFGSRLYLLERAKNTDNTMRLAMDYCKEALQWMIDAGLARTVNVRAQRTPAEDLYRLKLLIEVTPANSDQPVAFSTFINVV
jgi:phage gp46-like protein